MQLCTVLLNYFIHSRIKASLILHGRTTLLASSKSWVKVISIHLIRNFFSLFLVIYYRPTRKILVNYLIHDILHDYWRNTFAYNICHGVDIHVLLHNIWLLLLVNISSKLFTIIDYYEFFTFFSYNNFPEKLPSSMKLWFFLKTKLEK